MFNKLVAVEPIGIDDASRGRLGDYARSVTLHTDRPISNAEIISRIGDADAMLVSYTTVIDGDVLRACPKLRYVGMCCSLYEPKSASVDVITAQQLGIVVKGVNDYGDDGVPEFVVSELVRLLHGVGGTMWRDSPNELRGLNIGVLGMGVTGILVARALAFFGANISYYSRTRKPEIELSDGFEYLPLDDLLRKAQIVCCCLTKNTILLNSREFELLGDGKILVNTCIGPSHDVAALEQWLRRAGNFAIGDNISAIDPGGRLISLPNVICWGFASGMTHQARQRLGRKSIENIEEFLSGK